MHGWQGIKKISFLQGIYKENNELGFMHLCVFSKLGSLTRSLGFRQDVNYGIYIKRQSKACLEPQLKSWLQTL